MHIHEKIVFIKDTSGLQSTVVCYVRCGKTIIPQIGYASLFLILLSFFCKASFKMKGIRLGNPTYQHPPIHAELLQWLHSYG